MNKPFHAFCIASTQSGGGKTTVSLALMAALSARGLRVQAFKCGPDYIDPSFHRQATGLPSFNLDTWMMGKNGVRSQWARHASCADIAICEGVMGLFDARTPESLEGSTADCALTLGLPVLLVVQARGMAGSIAAVVRGFSQHHPGLNIAGVIANGVGNAAHADLLRRALDHHRMPPLVAAFPKNAEWTLPERQLGLVPAEEEARQQSWFLRLAAEAEKRVNWELLMNITERGRPEPLKVPLPPAPPRGILAVARDNAFCFYYGDNLERLKQTGWDITCFSPLEDTALPEGTQALYLGAAIRKPSRAVWKAMKPCGRPSWTLPGTEGKSLRNAGDTCTFAMNWRFWTEHAGTCAASLTERPGWGKSSVPWDTGKL